MPFSKKGQNLSDRNFCLLCQISKLLKCPCLEETVRNCVHNKIKDDIFLAAIFRTPHISPLNSVFEVFYGKMMSLA